MAVTTNNILLKVTVPKRTGRKRKRGETGPFLIEQEIERCSNGSSGGSKPHNRNAYVDARTIYRSLQDNVSAYKVSITGVVDEVHRFRSKYLNRN
jgi:general transcription factor 3C polypeptide 5 (transcription factor C subunit 1)